MGAMSFILHVGLIITFGLTVTTEAHTHAEPNLECFNDYLSEMMCILTLAELDNCTEYSLNASGYKDFFTCDFKQLDSNVCECLFYIVSGFVVNENYNIKVLKQKSVLFTKNVSTTEGIKPKKPFIVSVNQTEEGNFHIVWDTIYKTSEPVFNEELISELTYYVEGNSESRKKVSLNKGEWEYMLVGRNLESSSNYTVRARMRTNLNLLFSDYSDPYWFTTPPSPNDNLKIIIPIICVILIIFIFTMYYYYNKLLIEWWEKIPTPKIATNFVKQVPNLMSFQNDFSPVHLDSSKVVRPGEKTWLASSLVDVRGENSLNNLGKDGSSSEVVYGQTGNESVGDNNARWELVKETNGGQIPMSSQYYKNTKTKCDVIQRKSGNSSGFSNNFYMYSSADKLSKPNDSNGKENLFSILAKNQDPVIQTDFEYSPCTGCLGSENNTPMQFTPSSNEIIMVPTYQSVNDVIDCTPTDQAFINSRNDVNLILEKLMCSKSPQNVSCDFGIIQVENGYKDFQSLLQNSGDQQSREAEQKQLCGPALHTSPSIQIDCSYHRV